MRAALAAILASSALALEQPNGTVIPASCVAYGACPPNPCLTDVLSCNGLSEIDIQADASDEPDAFLPDGTTVFHFLYIHAGADHEFGWYNADPAVLDPERHVIFPFGSRPEDKEAEVTITWASEPAYEGGAVGFYLYSSGNVLYSEEARNEDISGSISGWYYLLKYSDAVAGCRFFLAWEDLLTGGDNDFNDVVFSVSGVSAACTMDIDGGAICPAGSECENGVCINTTCSGVGGCPAGSTCDPVCGICVNNCQDVFCTDGMTCDENTGECVPADPCAAGGCGPVPPDDDAGTASTDAESYSEKDTAWDTFHARGCSCSLGRDPIR